MTDTLHIAEIPYEDGSIHFRYARIMSTDGTRWIRHGLFRSFYPDGTLQSEGEYRDDLEQGEWKDFFPNGQIAAHGVYDQGVEVGDWTFWNADGAPEQAQRED